ncbi:MAG: hypothetical protein IT291_02775 [Deltaproteobacteria bacterium]|nr:hypothetical protein [Deltaproteobacteria bacterium]
MESSCRHIPNNRVGIVEKLFSPRGSISQGIIARGGEAGYQPWILRGGWHLMFPFIYRIHKVPLVTIPQGSIGYVFSRDGFSLSPEQTLASNTQANDFENVLHFLENGEQKGHSAKCSAREPMPFSLALTKYNQTNLTSL